MDDAAIFGNSWIFNPDECHSLEPPGGYQPCEELEPDDVEDIRNICGLITDTRGILGFYDQIKWNEWNVRNIDL